MRDIIYIQILRLIEWRTVRCNNYQNRTTKPIFQRISCTIVYPDKSLFIFNWLQLSRWKKLLPLFHYMCPFEKKKKCDNDSRSGPRQRYYTTKTNEYIVDCKIQLDNAIRIVRATRGLAVMFKHKLL